jgi:hypothetical protein
MMLTASPHQFMDEYCLRDLPGCRIAASVTARTL